MTEPERDERVARAYRALGSEEPPAVLDAEILAASRRRGRHWRVPLAAAAALVLAVGVALVVEREERTSTEEVALAPRVMETPAPMAGPRGEARSAVAPAVAPAAPGKRERSDEVERRVGEAVQPARQASAPAADQVAPAAGVSGALRAAKPLEKSEAPELWLERIAALREQGRHREADESLAEFRRRHRDYLIPEPMLRRVAPP